MSTSWVNCDSVEKFYRCFSDNLIGVEEAHTEIEESGLVFRCNYQQLTYASIVFDYMRQCEVDGS